MVEWTGDDQTRFGDYGRKLIQKMIEIIGQPRPEGNRTRLNIPRRAIVIAHSKGYNWSQIARFWHVSRSTIIRRYKGE